jgi:hypothetical protein
MTSTSGAGRRETLHMRSRVGWPFEQAMAEHNLGPALVDDLCSEAEHAGSGDPLHEGRRMAREKQKLEMPPGSLPHSFVATAAFQKTSRI